MAMILGVPFSNKNMEETVDLLNEQIDNKITPFHVVTANPEMVMNAKRNRKFRLLLKNADLVTPDGIGIVIGSKMLKEDVKERVTGYDTIHQLLKKREEEQKTTRLYLLGAQEEVIALAANKVKEQYPHVEVVGYHHGYFEPRSTEEERIVEEMKQVKPDLVLVGLGSPRQEEFIATHKEVIAGKVYIGCGGAFDVLSGTVERAPEMVQKLYLEWFWRLVKDPKRWKRQLDIPRFLIEVVKEKRKK